MRRHFSLGILCFLLLVFAQVFPAKQAGADAAFFETPEYFASTGLHSLNASQAYALGFSGKGITVAVLDSKFSAARGEFLGKYPYGIFGPKDDDDDDHGIHVSGIIAAHKNDKGMHGVDYDALLMPLTPEYGAQDEEGLPGNLES